MSSLFQADDYVQYRLHYPAAIFEPLKPNLFKGAKILDLGAGTGFAAASFLEFFPDCEFTLVEPDEKMLEAARSRLRSFPQAKIFLLGSAESISFDAKQFDVILIASAWHWMNFEVVSKVLEKILKPGGVVFICEYRLPKAEGESAAELNEWVRRQFNLYWRAPSQVPRGTLQEITESLRCSPAFSQKRKIDLNDSQLHSVKDFAGMLFSQSRFLHYETSLSNEERAGYREIILEELNKKWGLQNEISFLYPFQGFVFQRRPD